MQGLRADRRQSGSALALFLFACALLLRVVVPGGWMPTTGADGLVRITMCTGMGPVEAWLDADGKLHDTSPAKGEPKTDQPCAFAGLIAPALDPAPVAPPFRATAERDRLPAFATNEVAIGRGLAAPPPPPTGPPAIL